MTTAKPKTNGAAPSHGPHAPTFDKPPPLSVFMDRAAREFACSDPRFDDIKHPAIRRLAAAVSPPEAPPVTVDQLTSSLAFLCVLEAVKHGATLVLTGPGSPPPLVVRGADPSHKQIGATLESQTGARFASAYGDDLTTVLIDLAQKYGAAS